MTDSYSCLSAYHVALAHGLPYRQLFMYIQRLLLMNRGKLREGAYV